MAMKHYKNLNDLILQWRDLPVPGRIYVNRSSHASLASAQFWAIASSMAKNENFVETSHGTVPESVARVGGQSFLDSATFQDIIENKFDHNPGISLNETALFIEAIEYYLREDDFLD